MSVVGNAAPRSTGASGSLRSPTNEVAFAPHDIRLVAMEPRETIVVDGGHWHDAATGYRTARVNQLFPRKLCLSLPAPNTTLSVRSS